MKRALVATILVVCAACGSSGDPVSGDRRNVGGVTQTFTVTPSQARVGQPVQVGIRLVNNGGTAVELTFPSSQQYDFWVTGADGEIWRWSDGMVFTQALTYQTIGGQSGSTFSESWTPTEPGTYVVHGMLTAQGYDREQTADLEVE